MSTLITKSLSDLKAAMLPKATSAGIGFNLVNEKEPGTPEYAKTEKVRQESLAQLDAYLAEFVLPDKEVACVMCGTAQSGLLGGFTWGLVHGEGDCSVCGYPARGYHRVTVPAGVVNLNFILQYHPDGLEERGQP